MSKTAKKDATKAKTTAKMTAKKKVLRVVKKSARKLTKEEQAALLKKSFDDMRYIPENLFSPEPEPAIFSSPEWALTDDMNKQFRLLLLRDVKKAYDKAESVDVSDNKEKPKSLADTIQDDIKRAARHAEAEEAERAKEAEERALKKEKEASDAVKGAKAVMSIIGQERSPETEDALKKARERLEKAKAENTGLKTRIHLNKTLIETAPDEKVRICKAITALAKADEIALDRMEKEAEALELENQAMLTQDSELAAKAEAIRKEQSELKETLTALEKIAGVRAEIPEPSDKAPAVPPVPGSAPPVTENDNPQKKVSRSAGLRSFSKALANRDMVFTYDTDKPTMLLSCHKEYQDFTIILSFADADGWIISVNTGICDTEKHPYGMGSIKKVDAFIDKVVAALAKA